MSEAGQETFSTCLSLFYSQICWSKKIGKGQLRNILHPVSLFYSQICRSRKTECNRRGVCAAVAPRVVVAASSPAHLRQTSASSLAPLPHRRCSLPLLHRHRCHPHHSGVNEARKDTIADYIFSSFVIYERKSKW